MYRIPTVMLIGAMCAAVAGCGEPAADTPTETAPAAQGGSAASMPIAGVRGDPEVRHAMQCWGVTNGSYLIHMASPDRVVGFPQASMDDYRAWSAQAEILIRDKGGTLDDYNALQSEFQERFLSEESRQTLRPVLEECLRTVPVAALEVEQPILTGP